MATYVNDLRLKEIATGDESGTWGTSTNTNLELIANAMGVGAEAVANASTHTMTMADGTADEFRSTFLRLTGGGQACTVTLAPNTLSHTWIMRNETAAALTLTQGSGANVVIAAGQTKIVATDGAGSGAIVYEMDDLELAGNLAVDGAITSSSGATITVADNSNNLTLTSTDGDANAGPKLDLYRNSTGPADGDLLGRINFRGRNDNSQDVDYAAWVSRISDASDGSEDGILRADVIAAGAVVDVLTLYGTEVVVNESSADVDFRVESDANTHALFVQGSDGNVGIGVAAPAEMLEIYNASSPAIQLNDGGDYKSIFRLAGNDLEIRGSSGSLEFYTGSADGDSSAERMHIDSSGLVNIFGTASGTEQFRVGNSSGGTDFGITVTENSGVVLNAAEGSTARNMQFSIGGTEKMRIDSSGKVGIGTSAPSALLGLNAAAPDFTMLQSDSVKFRMGVSNTTNGGVTGSASGDFFARTAGGKMLFSTDDGVTSAMSIDANDNLLIGTTASGSAGLNVSNSINIGFSEGSNSSIANIFRQSSSAATILGSGYKVTSTANKYASSYASAWARTAVACHYGSIRFFADAAATVAVGTDITPTERMRIDESGNLLVGKTSAGTAQGFEAQQDGEVYSSIVNGLNTYHVYANSGYRFYVKPDGGIVNYSDNNVNLSDEREKKNIEALESQWDSLKQWSLKKFHYNADADSDTKRLGVIAQEVEAHNPEVVSEFNVNENTIRMAVKEQPMMWMAIKALQEAQERIETLETKVQALEKT